MSGKVYLRDWNDPEVLYEATEVYPASNGIVEVEARNPATGHLRRGAWWRWKCEGADDLYQYLDQLATLPGWSVSLREMVFANLEARQAGRRRRYVSSLTGEASQGRGSAFTPPARSSRP